MALELNAESDVHSNLVAELKDLVRLNCNVRGVDFDKVNANDGLFNGSGELKLDSLDAVEIAVAVEKKYGLQMRNSSSARTSMSSLGALAEHIIASGAY